MNLEKLYLDPRFSGAFSGANKFYREVKKIHPHVTMAQVRKTLAKIEAYTIHKKATKPKIFRKTWSFAPGHLWQMDLLDLQKYKTENDGFKYLCVIIDVFSKFAWVKPLRRKTAKSLVKALALLIMTERPKKIMADQGSEFHNADVSRMLEAFGAKLYFVYSEKKASTVERLLRTLRGKLGRIFTQNRNHNWLKYIQDVVHSYNNTEHSTIKMRPAEVTDEHHVKIRQRLYPGRAEKTAKFRVNQKVRIIAKRRTFGKEFEGQWTKEIFRIKVIQLTNPITYLLEDSRKEAILGSFYEAELQNVD